jgi:hypothetical protein
MTKQMDAHKMKEAAMDDMINIMHKARVSHVKVMYVLQEFIGGPQNLNITERDIQNRYTRNFKKLCEIFMCKND